MTRPVVTVSDADAYFLTTPRNAEWLATAPNHQVWITEAQRWLNGLCYDETRDCCGRVFADAWVEAVSELALALSKHPDAIISSSVSSTSSKGAIQSQALGDLRVSYYDTKSGQTAATKYGVQSPKVLQAFPWLGDIIGCWLNVASGTSRIISRCC